MGYGLAPGSAWAEICTNEDIRVKGVNDLQLPDCRAYEQVSPVAKNFTDAVGAPGLVQASPLGEAITFFSLVPFPETLGAADFVTYLSTRKEDRWSTQGLLPPTNPASVAGVVGLTADLSRAIISDFPSTPPLAEGATSGQINFYVRENSSGSYRLLAGPGGEAYYADATADGSRIIFEDQAQLLPGASKGTPNLYEWDNGQVSLIAAGAVAGPGGPALEASRQPGGATSEFYTQNTISEDGSRMFFSNVETGKIYVRETWEGSERTGAVSIGAAFWRAATPDGRYVFYTESGELYRFAVEGAKREAVASSVAGTLGVSNDGSYVYYVVGGGELYGWHDGTNTLIMRLTPFTDISDWLGNCLCNGSGAAGGEKSASVAPNGERILFSASKQLYLYDSASRILECISCNRNGTFAYLTHSESESAPRSRNPFIVRNLSDEGDRVFFETEAALVPQDTNGKMDVYEWEREGTEGGSCQEGEGDERGGCLYLISTGASESPSYFGDASMNGDNVFFFTRESLVNQDRDDNLDIYDARVGGGIAAQNQSSSDPCSGEACREVLGSQLVFNVPSTAEFSGLGNLTYGEKGGSGKHRKRKVHSRSNRSKRMRRRGARRSINADRVRGTRKKYR